VRAQKTEAAPLGSVSPALVVALRRLLRPLVRLLLCQQITFPFFKSLLKAVYVEVATQRFTIEGRQTDSRLSLLTGVHRKECRRLRQELPFEDPAPRSATLGAQLVARWTGAPEFLDDDGRPLPLPRTSKRGSGPSFERLVASGSKDIRPRSVLDEWLRLGVVYFDAAERVCLRVEAFVPEKGFDEKAFYFGRNLRDHIAAAANNLEGVQAPMLERSVYYDGLTDDSVRELEELSEKVGMEALQAVNQRAIALKQRDSRSGEGAHRITLGIYFFRGPVDDA